MPKVTIEFNTDVPEEYQNMRRALGATDTYLVINAMLSELRKVWKYSTDKEKVKYATHWSDVLYDILDNYNINMEDLP